MTTDAPLTCEGDESGAVRSLHLPLITRLRDSQLGPNAPLRRVAALEVALW